MAWSVQTPARPDSKSFPGLAGGLRFGEASSKLLLTAASQAKPVKAQQAQCETAGLFSPLVFLRRDRMAVEVHAIVYFLEHGDFLGCQWAERGDQFIVGMDTERVFITHT